jgi:ABC-type enterochelin transport system ATPase subunit
MLRFADDIVIITENEKDLKKILETLEQVMEKDLHMKINTKKTKILVFSRYNITRTRLKLKDGKTIEQVEDFVYLDGTKAQMGDSKNKL